MKNLHLNHLKTIIKCVLLEDAVLEDGTTKCSVCGAPVRAEALEEKAPDAICPYCRNPYNWDSYNQKYGSKPETQEPVDLSKLTSTEESALRNLKTDERTSVDVAKMFYVEMKNSFKDISGPGQIKAKYGFYKPIIRISDTVNENVLKQQIVSAYNRAEPQIQQLMRKVGGVIVNGKFYSFDKILPSSQTPQQAAAPKRPVVGGMFGPLPAKR